MSGELSAMSCELLAMSYEQGIEKSDKQKSGRNVLRLYLVMVYQGE